MINYRGIDEFITDSQIANLEYFDDEFFVILDFNRPRLIAFPLCIKEKVKSKFMKKEILVKLEEVYENKSILDIGELLTLVRNRGEYYSIIPYGREEVIFVEKVLIDYLKRNLTKSLSE